MKLSKFCTFCLTLFICSLKYYINLTEGHFYFLFYVAPRKNIHTIKIITISKFQKKTLIFNWSLPTIIKNIYLFIFNFSSVLCITSCPFQSYKKENGRKIAITAFSSGGKFPNATQNYGYIQKIYIQKFIYSIF